MSSAEEKLNVQAQEQAAIFTIMKFLLRKLCEERELTTADLRTLPLQDFLEWAPEVYRMVTTEATQAQLEKLAGAWQVNLGHLRLVSHILANPYLAAVTLVRIWPALVLGHGELIQPPVKFLHFAVTVGFADGTLAQVQVPTHIPPGMGINDGHVVSAWMMQLEGAIAAVREHGVVGLRKLDGRTVEDLQTREQQHAEENPLAAGPIDQLPGAAGHAAQASVAEAGPAGAPEAGGG